MVKNLCNNSGTWLKKSSFGLENMQLKLKHHEKKTYETNPKKGQHRLDFELKIFKKIIEYY